MHVKVDDNLFVYVRPVRPLKLHPSIIFDVWTFWTLNLDTESQNIQREIRKCN